MPVAYQLPLIGTLPPSPTPPGFLDFWAVGGLDDRVGMALGYDGPWVRMLFPGNTIELFPPHCLFPVLEALEDQEAYARRWWTSRDWRRRVLRLQHPRCRLGRLLLAAKAHVGR
jgi:hypothetical protein